MSKLEHCLIALKDMEWKYQYVDNGPDEWTCPDGCWVQAKGSNSSNSKKCVHYNNCQYKLVLDYIEYMISKENPNDILKEIL